MQNSSFFDLDFYRYAAAIPPASYSWSYNMVPVCYGFHVSLQASLRIEISLSGLLKSL